MFIEHATAFCLGLGAETNLQDREPQLHLVLRLDPQRIRINTAK